MTTSRRLQAVIESVAASDGAGVKLRRSLGSRQNQRFDPFLMLDEFFSDDPDDYLAGFTLAAAFIFHGGADQMQQIMLLKNVAVAGGFLFLVARGAGEWSLDARRERLTSPDSVRS